MKSTTLWEDCVHYNVQPSLCFYLVFLCGTCVSYNGHKDHGLACTLNLEFATTILLVKMSISEVKTFNLAIFNLGL
jgi:multisubunit Na+/H+ antiporter MnhB subunit